MPTAKVTKNVSAAIGGGNVLCSTLISIKTKAWLFSPAGIRTEFPTFGGGRTHPSGIAPILAGTGHKHRFGKGAM